MSIYALAEDDATNWFPSPDMFDGDIVAVGGNLSEQRLLKAYTSGIFPWYNEPNEILWWSPQTRCILKHENLKISHSMRSVINGKRFRVTMDSAFSSVLEGCRGGMRVGETWLIDEMVEAYTNLYDLGIGHSVEVWEEDQLVGGLYGLSIGKMFFGESMFSRVANSSKFAFITLSQFLRKKGWHILDCQVVTNHLLSLGSEAISRQSYLNLLEQELNYETQVGHWTEEFNLFVQQLDGSIK